jgi:hypothetical protein
VEVPSSYWGSVPVEFTLVGARDLDTNIVSLLLAKLRELGTKCRQMEPCNLLIEVFGKKIYVVLVCLLSSCPAHSQTRRWHN